MMGRSVSSRYEGLPGDKAGVPPATEKLLNQKNKKSVCFFSFLPFFFFISLSE